MNWPCDSIPGEYQRRPRARCSTIGAIAAALMLSGCSDAYQPAEQHRKVAEPHRIAGRKAERPNRIYVICRIAHLQHPSAQGARLCKAKWAGDASATFDRPSSIHPPQAGGSAQTFQPSSHPAAPGGSRHHVAG
jgi:hypothetical protein